MKITHKFPITYTYDGKYYIAFATNIPGIILQDVSLERIKNRIPKMVKLMHKVQLQELENGVQARKVKPEEMPEYPGKDKN